MGVKTQVGIRVRAGVPQVIDPQSRIGLLSGSERDDSAVQFIGSAIPENCRHASSNVSCFSMSRVAGRGFRRSR
jgi:hypothetical protein